MASVAQPTNKAIVKTTISTNNVLATNPESSLSKTYQASKKSAVPIAKITICKKYFIIYVLINLRNQMVLDTRQARKMLRAVPFVR